MSNNDISEVSLDASTSSSQSEPLSGKTIKLEYQPQTIKTVEKTSTDCFSTHIPQPTRLNMKYKENNRKYPLLGVETPHYLKRFAFDFDGTRGFFSEEHSQQQVQQQRHQKHDTPITTTVGKKRQSTHDHDFDDDSYSDNGQDELSQPPAKRAREGSAARSEQDELVLLSPPTPAANKEEQEQFENNITTGGAISRTTTTTTTVTTIEKSSQKLSPINEIPPIIQYYDSLPSEMKRYLLFNLMRRSDRSTLSAMTGEILPALRCDFLSLLPPELAFCILSHLDCHSLLNASLVCKNWKRVVDSADWVWRKLLVDDCLVDNDKLPEVLKQAKSSNSIDTASGALTPVQTPSAMGANINPYEQKEDQFLFKNIYRRKYIVSKNWMDPNSKPRHLSFKGHGRDVVTSLQFDKEKIITGSDDHTINVYDVETGKLRKTLTGHSGGVWALQYIGNNTLVSGATDRTVRVWDIAAGKCTHIFEGHTSTVRCLDILQPVEVTDKDGNVSIQPSEPLIVSGSRDSTLRVWRLPKPSDPEYNILGEDRGPDPFYLRSLTGHTHNVRAISGHGNTVVSGSYDTTVRVWNVNEGTCRWELQGHEQRVYGAVIDAKLNRCISGSMDWHVKVWCLETGSLLYTLEGHSSLVGLLDLNRTTLVSAAADSTLRVWNREDGEFLHKLSGHQGAITCFQHDENKVVSGSERTLKLWNTKTGKLVRDLLDGLSSIWQVKFDDRRCISAVKRGDETRIEVFDFDYDPKAPPETEEELEENDLMEQPQSPTPLISRNASAQGGGAARGHGLRGMMEEDVAEIARR